MKTFHLFAVLLSLPLLLGGCGEKDKVKSVGNNAHLLGYE